jgi:small-conductance mechanosensitive channel
MPEFLSDPRVQLVASLLLSTALLVIVLRRVLRRHSQALHAQAAPDTERRLVAELLHRALGPATLLVWYYGVYAAVRAAVAGGWLPAGWEWIDPLLSRGAALGVFLCGLWFFFRAADVLDARLRRVAARTAGRIDDVLLPLLGTALRVTVPILALFLLLRVWPISAAALGVARKLLGVALVAALTWVLRRAVVLTDAAVLGPQGLTADTSAERRALYTRVRMLRRIALVLITTFAFAAVLMMFDEVRDLGRSILASAGIAGIVIGFAAQRSLGTLFAGIQIALTQPIRLGDQVLVEGDVGNIEEITLTYVVVRVWDQRRIVLPISYFIEKPFQNWTRVTTNMLSPLVLRVDFSLPVGELRAHLEREIARSAFWDKKVFGVQVTNADAGSMEVRVLASAPDSGASFNLQCELREKAIEWIRGHYPQCLPKVRQEQRKIETWSDATALTDGHAPLVTPQRPAAEKPRPLPVPHRE